MFIQIDDNYALGSDRYSWHILKWRMRKTRKTGKVEKVWEAYQWFSTVQKATQGLGELMVRESEAQTFAEALAEIESVTAKLTQALAPQYVLIRQVDAA